MAGFFCRMEFDQLGRLIHQVDEFVDDESWRSPGEVRDSHHDKVCSVLWGLDAVVEKTHRPDGTLQTVIGWKAGKRPFTTIGVYDDLDEGAENGPAPEARAVSVAVA